MAAIGANQHGVGAKGEARRQRPIEMWEKLPAAGWLPFEAGAEVGFFEGDEQQVR